MNPVTELEDLEIWQMSFELAQRVYDVTEVGPFSRDFGMRNQIRRASVSSMSNIAEGYARMSKKEFVRFLDIARGSAVEVQSLLHLSKARSYITGEEFDEIYAPYGVLCRRMGALIRYLRRAAACRLTPDTRHYLKKASANPPSTAII
ncbi:MAG: four helix bundle protein [Rhodothermia bacterium]